MLVNRYRYLDMVRNPRSCSLAIPGRIYLIHMGTVFNLIYDYELNQRVALVVRDNI
jgi:hypothetical protein